MQLWNSWVHASGDAFPLFKKFSSKYKRRRQKQMVNLHEPQHTFMSPEINSPACPRRVCRLVGAILYPVAGRMTRCSEPARHTTSLLTQHQYREESGGGEGGADISMWQLPEVVNTSARKPTFGPDILNQLHASAGILSLHTHTNQISVRYPYSGG